MRARRSCLSVPARPAKMLEKGPGFAADEVILDLEDSVPVDLKDEARAAVADTLRSHEWAAATVSVRINAVGTEWCEADVAAVAGAADCVIVPKAESAAGIEEVARLLGAAEGNEGSTGIEALIESARGLRGAGRDRRVLRPPRGADPRTRRHERLARLPLPRRGSPLALRPLLGAGRGARGRPAGDRRPLPERRRCRRRGRLGRDRPRPRLRRQVGAASLPGRGSQRDVRA